MLTCKNCLNPRIGGALGYCSSCYNRWHRYGDPNGGTTHRRRNTLQLVAYALTADTDECIVRPDSDAPYPTVNINGKRVMLHAHVCEQIYGKKPHKRMQVAHSCNNSRCFNPKHLRWATPAENAADRIQHGTQTRGDLHKGAKLTEVDVRTILADWDAGTISQAKMAVKYGVSRGAIQAVIERITWKWIDHHSSAPNAGI